MSFAPLWGWKISRLSLCVACPWIAECIPLLTGKRASVTQGGMRGVPRLLFYPRPHLSLVLASSQRWANGTSVQNRLIKLAHSKDNTDPNQSETPVERLWAGTQDTPWGCHQQGQVESRTVCYWACHLPTCHFLISLVLPQTTTARNIFSRNQWV